MRSAITQASRFLKLTSGLAKASSNFIIQDKLQASIMASTQIVKTMAEMKGVMMKLGQMISISEDLVFPKEVTALFSKLQTDAIPMSNADLNKVFMESFGRLPEQIFLQFDRTPFAKASIGQVHRAQIAGTGSFPIQVAVKVQYPQMLQSIESDLANIKNIEKLLEIFSISKVKIDHFITELKDSILQECDYELEAKELIFFYDKISKEFPTIKIPQCFLDYSTKRILTLEYYVGDNLEMAKNYTQEARDYLGTLLYESYLYELFTLNKIHSDPQNGNYLFRPNCFVKLDFGSTKTFHEDFIIDYCLILLSLELKDFSIYKFAANRLHFLYPNDPTQKVIEQFEFLLKLYSPLLKKGTYPLENVDLFSWMKDYLKKVDMAQQRMPKSEFLMLDRANLGLFTKVKSLKSQINWEYGRQKYRKNLDQKALSMYQHLKNSI